jgi:hypothetical protein
MAWILGAVIGTAAAAGGAIAAFVVGALLAGGVVFLIARQRTRRALARSSPVRRIAFPFTGAALSEPALVAALRMAHAEHATLVPIYLALVPLDVALDVPLRTECEAALPLLEAIEQRAARAGVAVDARIERGRSVRHALGLLMEHERFERMVVPAAADRRGAGLPAEDVAWLLTNAPFEVVALRPARRGPFRQPVWLGQDPTAPRSRAAGGGAGAGAPVGVG